MKDVLRERTLCRQKCEFLRNVAWRSRRRQFS